MRECDTLLMGGDDRANESPSNGEKPAKDGRFPHWRKVIGWVLGVGGAFVTALVTGFAGKIVDQFSGHHPDASVTQTEVRFVQPFDLEGNLQAPFKADEAKTFRGGSCRYGSPSSDPDAMRCFAGDLVLDPCWEGLGERVACPSNPWDKTVWLLLKPVIEPRETPSPFPSSGPPSTSSAGWNSSTAWALELLDPFHPKETLRCLMLTGAGDWIAGNRVNWSCSNGSPKGYAVGDVNKRPDKPWTVLYMATGTSEGRDATVKTVWR
jgi:hypothetical protein